MLKAARLVRSALLRAAGNVGLYLFVAFLAQTVLRMGPLDWYRDSLGLVWSMICVPWGAALCLLRLERRVNCPREELRADLTVLFALLVWIVVPFALRFGLNVNTANSWYNHAVVFFGLYALLTEESEAQRARVLDLTGALFAALSFALAVPALYCVIDLRVFGVGVGEYPFGIYFEDMLFLGTYYNSSGIYALCCALLSLIGVFRRRSLIARLAHLIPSVMMMIVVVLTQSRTSRYALIAALALGAWGALLGRLAAKPRLVRHAAALLAAFAVLAGGYTGARALTNAALNHFARLRAARTLDETAHAMPLPVALAEDDAQPDARPDAVPRTQQREGFSFSFQGRVDIWRAIFSLWVKNPKHMLLGYGMGNAGRQIAAHANLPDFPITVEAHNTFLQFAVDYGLVGLALMLAFLGMLVRPFFRVLLAAGDRARPGDRVLCMIALAMLLFGMMESYTLGAMQPVNLVFFFSLAHLFARSRELAKLAL